MAYEPVVIDPANIVVLEVECVGDVLEVTFAVRGTTTGGLVLMPPPVLVGSGDGATNGTTWSIISWPGFTTSTSTAAENKQLPGIETLSTTTDDINGVFLVVGLALVVVCLICLVVAAIVLIRRHTAGGSLESLPMHDMDYEPLNLDSICAQPLECQIEKLIGSGQFGNVYRGSTSRGETVAVKELNVHGMSAHDLAELKLEALLLERCQHDFVVAFLGVIDREAVAPGPGCPALSDGIFMVMALCEFGDLRSAIRANETGGGIVYDPISILHMAAQAASGLTFLHEQKVVHRDMALRNLLVAGTARPAQSSPLQMTDGSSCRVLISDFGLGRLLGNEYAAYYSKNEGQLPIRWTAPEAVLKGRYSRESDVYAFGVTICELISGGQLPFRSYQASEIINVMTSEGAAGRAGPNVPSFVVTEKPDPFVLPWSGLPIIAEMWQLALDCCAMDPVARPTFRKVVDVLAEQTALHADPIAGGNFSNLTDVRNGISDGISSRRSLDASAAEAGGYSALPSTVSRGSNPVAVVARPGSPGVADSSNTGAKEEAHYTLLRGSNK